jgi:Periplasmic binding protein-like domain
VCQAVVESALREETRPTAVVVRSPWLARNVIEVIHSLALKIPRDVDLIVGNHHQVEIDGRRLPGARPVKSMLECGRKLGRMLADLGQRRPFECRQEFVSIDFVE